MSVSDRISRGVAYTRLANEVGDLMSRSRDALRDAQTMPGGPASDDVLAALRALEAVANRATSLLCRHPAAGY